MSSLPRVGSCLVALAMVAACTSHGRDEGTQGERAEAEPAPERALAPEQPPPPPRDPVTLGPRTPLHNKPFAGAIGELTGDGQPDVLALCHMPEAAGLVLLRGAPDGSFIEGEPELVEGSGLALGDFDGDADLDALILDARGKPAYRVGRNDGNGTFTIGPEHRILGSYGGELQGASLADLDGDKKLDALVPLWDSLRILPGDGKGGFRSGRALKIGRDPFDTKIADLDGDGQLDIVATSQSGPVRDKDSYDSGGASVWIYPGHPRGFAAPTRVEVSGAKQVEVADLDGDLHPELVVSGAGGLTVIHDPLGTATTERVLVATDGPLLVTDMFPASPGPELLTPSYMQSRLHIIAGYPKPEKISLEAGNFVVGMYTAGVGEAGRADVVLLNAGPPGGVLGPPAPSIEVLFVTTEGQDCARCGEVPGVASR